MNLSSYKHIDGLTDRAAMKYNLFVQTLKLYNDAKNPVKSKKIEKALKITASEVGALRRLAWEKGVPVGSGRKGYFYAKSVSEWSSVKQQVEVRKSVLMKDAELCHKIYMKLVAESQGTVLDESQLGLL